MRIVVLANEDERYCKLMNEAYMCLPDGMPHTWMARLWGLKEASRTDGPDLFVSMLNKPENAIKHFLLGDTEETLAAMKEKFHNAHIVDTCSPPFKPLEEYDLPAMAKRINESGANIVWGSLRAPKQDYFAQKLMSFLDDKLCKGVGAAFHFALGQYKHPNKVFQKMGLTGFLWREIGLQRLLTYSKWMLLCVKWRGQFYMPDSEIRLRNNNLCYAVR